MANDTYAIIGSSGELEIYNDAFKNVTAEQVELAARLEQEIAQARQIVELGFLALAERIEQFEREKLYKARGFEKFKDWVESPQIELSHRVAQDLIRIQREVVALLSSRGYSAEQIQQMMLTAGISKIRALLPLLSDGVHNADFVELLSDANQITWRDLQNEVKDRLGKASAIEDGYPVMFHTKVIRKAGDDIIVAIEGHDGNIVEHLGQLTIRKEWYPRWINRISE